MSRRGRGRGGAGGNIRSEGTAPCGPDYLDLHQCFVPVARCRPPVQPQPRARLLQGLSAHTAGLHQCEQHAPPCSHQPAWVLYILSDILAILAIYNTECEEWWKSMSVKAIVQHTSGAQSRPCAQISAYDWKLRLFQCLACLSSRSMNLTSASDGGVCQ